MSARVSANLIALDEQRNIARCLQSLDWVDEIVVVDGGSSDATVDIARQFTDRVYLHPFDDYASQRNRAISRSTGDWILSVDCDEVVPRKLATEIQQRVATASPQCHGYWIPIRSRIFGRQFRYCGTQNERKMRLFRRSRGHWQGAVHETVHLASECGMLQGGIEHESTPDLDTYLRKLIRYSSLECERLLQSGCRPRRWQPWLVPLWRFAKLYFAKLGLLDGPEGLRYCMLSGWEAWITYQKLFERARERGTKKQPAPADRMELKEAWHGSISVAA